jgi:DNA repair exonuclease SbcCD ATPase subunit
LPLNTTLIQGSQSLFGIRTDLRFGRLTVQSILSQQKGKRQEINVAGGAQVQDYSVRVDNYEANKHYFVNYYHREHYDEAMKTMPNVSSPVNVTKIEVWVTNRINKPEDTRNVIAFTDLGEGKIENLEGEHRIKTEKLIKDTIGNVNDFMLTILATSNNLESIIDAKQTEKSTTLTRFLGLDIMQIKEEIGKKLYSEWKLTNKSNQTNTETLKNKLENINNNINLSKNEIISLSKMEKDLLKEIENLNYQKDILNDKRGNVEDFLVKLNIEEVNGDIKKVNKLINDKKTNLKVISDELNEEIFFDEEKYDNSLKEEKIIISQLSQKNTERISNIRQIKQLKEEGICSLCKRPFEHDHTEEINLMEKQLLSLENEIVVIKENEKLIKNEIDNLNSIKYKKDEKLRKELIKDKYLVEIEGYESKIEKLNSLIERYYLNEENIKVNREIKQKIFDIEYYISGLNDKIKNINKESYKYENLLQNYDNEILEINNLLKELKKEETVTKVFNLYLQMVGKNGISKIVLKNIIPIINTEIYRLINDTVDFNVEIDINDKDEVEFYMIDSKGRKPLYSCSGYERVVSSIALRVVLSKISFLPKPNILVLDEITGKVANENMGNLFNMLEKVKQNFDIVFMITHNEVAKEWGNFILEIKKEDNISSIVFE